MPTETSNDVIIQLKSIFARHGIPQEVCSDNGPQFSSSMFKKFSKEYKFSHITSSPRYPASNGKAERAVRTVKTMLKNVMTLRTKLPMLSSQLEPFTPDYDKLLQKESEYRARQKQNYDSHHRSRELVQLLPGDNVYISDGNISTEGQVTQQVAPRSFQVNTPHGSLRRNRRHLHLLPNSDNVRVSRKPVRYRL